MKKFISICEYLLFGVFLILLFFMKSKLAVILTIPIIIIIVFFEKKERFKHFSLFLFMVALAIRLISSFYLDVEVLDDFKTMLSASKDLINGNLSFVNNFYFQTFSYQLGHVIYQSLLLKIFNKVIFLKIVNSIITSLICVFIYLISRKMFKEKIARGVALLYLFYLYPIYLNSVLTNQHLPALIYLVVIYLLICNRESWKYYVLMAILLALSNFFRTEGIIFILAIIIFNIMNFTKKKGKMIFKNILVLIFVYFGVNLLMSQLVFLSPIHTHLTNKATEWKFYCGLNYEKNGLYNVDDEEKFFSSSEPRKLLLNRIKSDYLKFPILFLKKEVILWTQTNYDLSIRNSLNSNFYNVVLLFNQGYLNMIMILFVISLFPRKDKNKTKLLIKIILALYFGIYMFIEISPRYAYVLHILIFLILGNAIERGEDFLKKRQFLKDKVQ